MDDAKTQKKHSGIADLPDGIKALIELPAAQKSQPILLPAAPNIPNAGAQHAERPKTPKELELDALVSQRQSIIESLKAKNPLVLASRKKIAEIIPSIRGKGAPQAIKLMEQAEKIEFSIATEAYTPKKEKDLIKSLRGIRAELSQHKELESAQKKVDAERANLHSIMSEIRSLEGQLATCRKACEAKYGEILADRKAAYEQRQKRRDERAAHPGHAAGQGQQRMEPGAQRRSPEQGRHKRFDGPRERPRHSERREYDEDIAKYMKKHDDTVSMEEIVQIEKKEKKEKKDE